jgi:hypothetical protein
LCNLLNDIKSNKKDSKTPDEKSGSSLIKNSKKLKKRKVVRSSASKLILIKIKYLL